MVGSILGGGVLDWLSLSALPPGGSRGSRDPSNWLSEQPVRAVDAVSEHSLHCCLILSKSMRDRQRVIQILPTVNEKIDSSPPIIKSKCVSSVLNQNSVVCVCMCVFLCYCVWFHSSNNPDIHSKVYPTLFIKIYYRLYLRNISIFLKFELFSIQRVFFKKSTITHCF